MAWATSDVIVFDSTRYNADYHLRTLLYYTKMLFQRIATLSARRYDFFMTYSLGWRLSTESPHLLSIENEIWRII